MVDSTSSDTTIMYVLILGAMLLTFLVVLGLLRLCCQRNTEFMRVAYPVAISNRLFQVSSHFVYSIEYQTIFFYKSHLKIPLLIQQKRVFDKNPLLKTPLKFPLLLNKMWDRPYFSTNPTFQIPLKNPSSYFSRSGFLRKTHFSKYHLNSRFY